MSFRTEVFEIPASAISPLAQQTVESFFLAVFSSLRSFPRLSGKARATSSAITALMGLFRSFRPAACETLLDLSLQLAEDGHDFRESADDRS